MTPHTPSGRRAKPKGTLEARVFAFTPTAHQPTPPPDPATWRFVGVARHNTFTIEYPATAARQDAWITAAWVNTRGVQGPFANPIRGTVAA